MLGSSFSHMSSFWVCSLYPPSGAVYYSACQVELGESKFGWENRGLGRVYIVSGCFLKWYRSIFVISGSCVANDFQAGFHFCCGGDVFQRCVQRHPVLTVFTRGVDWDVYLVPIA